MSKFSVRLNYRPLDHLCENTHSFKPLHRPHYWQPFGNASHASIEGDLSGVEDSSGGSGGGPKGPPPYPKPEKPRPPPGS